MKISATALLVLGALLHQTSAFAPQSPKSFVVSGSPVFALGDAGSYQDPSAPPPASVDASRTKALEARLQALETGKSGKSALDTGKGAKPAPVKKSPTPSEPRTFMEQSAAVTVQGGSLKTWSYASQLVERVQVVLSTEGRPLDADVELWQGPDNTPHKMRVYCEDGSVRPFSAVIETPRGPNTIAIRNIGQMEFPLAAHVGADIGDGNPSGPIDVSRTADMKDTPRTIQGGALRTYPFDPAVESVQVLLKTDGRPLNARIELLQGPNNNKQVVELYTEDGNDRPFYVVLETPGSGNVVRVVNAATVEFPMTAWVEPYYIGQASPTQAVMGGDADGGFMTPPQW